MYLLQIHKIMDDLVSIRVLVPMIHHINMILEGFPIYYAPVIASIKIKFDVFDPDKIEVLLFAHELCVKNYKKDTLETTTSLNLTHVHIKFTRVVTSHSSPKDTPPSQSIEIGYNSFKGCVSRGGHENYGI